MLVNSVYAYDNDDGGRKIVIMFNLSKQNTAVIKGSDIERSAPLYSAYPNHLIYTKDCFGIVLALFIVADDSLLTAPQDSYILRQ